MQDLVILKSTGSEFKGFLKDEYTTLQETDDRIMATSLIARWRYEHTDVDDWNKSYDDIKRTMLEVFASKYSRGAAADPVRRWARRCSRRDPEVAEIKFSAPNKHHFLVDLSPFGLENTNEVFIAADRPYGLIEATVCARTAPTRVTPG